MNIGMNSIIHIAIMICIPIIIVFISSRHKKNKVKENKLEEKTKQLTTILADTKQHLKYKNRITIQTFIGWAVIILFMLCIIFLIYLPIFQIKYELLGVTIATKNFSYFDNYKTLKNEYDAASHFYTDMSSTSLVITISIVTALSSFAILVALINTVFINIERNTEKVFSEAKLDKKSYLDKYSFIWIIVLIAVFVYEIFYCKNAENEITSDRNFTVTQIDNYVYYYLDNGEFMCKVFLNDFKFCNGVSGYIAIPIICFAFGLILYFVELYLKNKLTKEIAAEKIEGLENIEQHTKNN